MTAPAVPSWLFHSDLRGGVQQVWAEGPLGVVLGPYPTYVDAYEAAARVHLSVNKEKAPDGRR